MKRLGLWHQRDKVFTGHPCQKLGNQVSFARPHTVLHPVLYLFSSESILLSCDKLQMVVLKFNAAATLTKAATLFGNKLPLLGKPPLRAGSGSLHHLPGCPGLDKSDAKRTKLKHRSLSLLCVSSKIF